MNAHDAPPRRTLRLVFSGLAAALALALLFLLRPAQKVDELRIGVLAPLSNTHLRLGLSLRALGELERRINAEGGLEAAGKRHKLRLVVRDSGNQMELLLSSVNQLLKHEGVSAIIGPFFSREAQPVAGLAEAARVPMLLPTASMPELTRGRSYVFRACITDTAQAQALAAFAVGELRQRRAAVLFDEADPYSSGQAELFRQAFARQGGEVVSREPYVPGRKDFSEQLGRIRASGAGVLLLPNFPDDLRLQMAQARKAGFKGVFLGGDGWDSDRSLRTLPEAQGAFFSADFAVETLPVRAREEISGYETVLGEALDKEAVLSLDCLGLLLAAAKAGGGSGPEALRKGLGLLHDYEGLTGRISFGLGGDAVRGVHILGIAEGRAHLRRAMPAQAEQ